MSGINSSTVLWYASRATGLVALVLLSAAMVLGITVIRQGRLPGLPRFAVTGLHRNLSLLALVFTIVHVLTAVADTYVSIPLAATVVPFVSDYEGFALGLGAITLDLMIAMIVTSLLRGRMNPKVWRAIHWLAYLSWPVGVVHSLLASTDLRGGWELAITVACILAVGVAAGWRVVAAARATPRAGRVSALMTKDPR